jgi:hypothetical protein
MIARAHAAAAKRIVQAPSFPTGSALPRTKKANFVQVKETVATPWNHFDI